MIAKTIKGGQLFLTTVMLASCSDNIAVRTRYNLEKTLYLAESRLRKASIRPELTSSDAVRQLRNSYSDFLEMSYDALEVIDAQKHPVEHAEIGELANIGAGRLAELFFEAGQFDSSETVLNTLLTKKVISDQSRMRVYHSLGRALQAGGALDSAIVVFDNAVREFDPPLQEDGRLFEPVFNLPLQIHAMFLAIGDTSVARKRYALAEEYYKRISVQLGDIGAANLSHRNLAQLYSAEERWDDVIDQLRRIKDSTGEPSLIMQVRIADLLTGRMGEHEGAVALYDSLRASLSETDTLLDAPILLRRSIAELNQGEFESARNNLIELEREYPGYFSTSPKAQYAKAQTFDKEGNWDRAELEYKFLLEQYPGSVEAMSTYLYLAERYEDNSRPEMARMWYTRGIEQYEIIAGRRRRSQSVSRALLFKAEAHKRMNDYPLAATTLVSLFTKYPDTRLGQLALTDASSIYRDELGQPEKADSLIEMLKTGLVEVDEEQEL